jgi:secondary thiamine-phosphate synthase enzyme
MTFSEAISLHTKGFSDIINITDQVKAILQRSRIEEGLVTVFCPGSTGAVTTIEYESGVLSDLKKAIENLFLPMSLEHDRRWGDGNGFSHNGRLLETLPHHSSSGGTALGTWQQIVFIDFDNRGRDRNILLFM